MRDVGVPNASGKPQFFADFDASRRISSGNLLQEAVTDPDTAHILAQETAAGLDPGLHVTDYTYDVNGLPQSLAANFTPYTSGWPCTTTQYASTLGWNWFYQGQQWVQTQPDAGSSQWRGLYASASGVWYDPVHGATIQPSQYATSDPATNPYSELSTYDRAALAALPVLTFAANAACFTPLFPYALPIAFTLNTLSAAAQGGTWGQAFAMGAVNTTLTLATRGAGRFISGITTWAGSPIAGALSSATGISTGLACRIVSPVVGGVVNAAFFGAMGAASGAAHGFIYSGWAAAGVEARQGFYTGAMFGGAIGFVQGIVDPSVCFVAGTVVHTATGKRVIESLRVGRRALTEESKNGAALPGDDPTEIDQATWRLLRLRTAKPAGSDNLVDVELLRPLAWIEQTQATVGSQIHFELAELGIDGPACVLAIEPCPEIESGRGRVITGTFTTAKCQVMQLGVSGEEKPLEPTPPHRFYSLDRGDYIAADKLAIGERLVTRAGKVATVESIGMKPGLHRVYNLEVEREHHFYVGESGVLVHNEYERQLWLPGMEAEGELPTTAARVAELKAQIPEGSRGYVTMAAGIAEEGEADAVRRYMLIGTSESNSYIRPGVSLNPGEIVVPGELDAEQNIVNFITNNKIRLVEIGATRPVCPDCVAAIKPTGATITTPLRQW